MCSLRGDVASAILSGRNVIRYSEKHPLISALSDKKLER